MFPSARRLAFRGPQTLGSIFRLFAFALIAYKLTVQRSAAGLSLKTLQASVLVSFFRLCSILVYDGYLPYDKSGDWFYQTIEIITLLLAGWSIFQIVGPHKGCVSRPRMWQKWERETSSCFAHLPSCSFPPLSFLLLPFPPLFSLPSLLFPPSSVLC